MTNSFISFIFGTVVFVLLGCSGRQVLKLREGVNEEAKDLTASIIWIKNKRDSVDIKIKLFNGYTHPVHVNRSSFKMTFNGRHGNLNEDSLEIALGSKEFKEQYLMFRFTEEIPAAGDAVFTIDPIYSGMSSEGDKTKMPKYTRTVNFGG